MTFMLGIPGLLLCIAVIWFYFLGSAAVNSRSPQVAALQHNVMLCAAITWMSPMLLIETTAMFLGLAVALAVRRSRATRASAGV